MNNQYETYPAYQVDSFHQGVLDKNPLLFNPHKGLNRVVSLNDNTKLLIIAGLMFSLGVFGFISEWVELQDKVPTITALNCATSNSAINVIIGLILGFVTMIAIHSYRGWKAEQIQLRVNSEILNDVKERHKIAVNLHKWADHLEAAMKTLEESGTDDYATTLIGNIRFLSVSLAAKKNLDQVNSLKNLFPDCYSQYHFQEKIDILNEGIMGRRKAGVDSDLKISALDEGKDKLDELLTSESERSLQGEKDA